MRTECRPNEQLNASKTAYKKIVHIFFRLLSLFRFGALLRNLSFTLQSIHSSVLILVHNIFELRGYGVFVVFHHIFSSFFFFCFLFFCLSNNLCCDIIPAAGKTCVRSVSREPDKNAVNCTHFGGQKCNELVQSCRLRLFCFIVVVVTLVGVFFFHSSLEVQHFYRLRRFFFLLFLLFYFSMREKCLS